MNSLATWLEPQRHAAHRWRSTLSRATAGFPAPLRKLASRAIWPGPLKHMRYLAPPIGFAVGPDGRWGVLENGQFLVESTSLSELIPRLALPVSIVATGPSALEFPWDRLRDGKRFVIAVNGAPTMLRDVGVVPDLMIVTDREFALSGARHFENSPGVPLAIEWLAAAALASTAPHFLRERPFAILERVNLWHGLPVLSAESLRQMNEASDRPFVLPDPPDKKCRVGWSHRPELGIFSGRTVTFAALQLAIGRGATDVEIIGMDLGGCARSYAEDVAKRPTQLQEHYESFILPSFQLMSRALENRDITVRNLSPVCPLPKALFPGS